MKLIILSGLLFITSSCATRPLTEKEKAVRILRNLDAPKECVEKGPVYAKKMQGLTWEGIRDQMKIDTFEVGGDTLVMIKNHNTSDEGGMAFKCEK